MAGYVNVIMIICSYLSVRWDYWFRQLDISWEIGAIGIVLSVLNSMYNFKLSSIAKDKEGGNMGKLFTGVRNTLIWKILVYMDG